MNPTKLLAALLAGALLSCGAQAQDPKPAAEPQSDAPKAAPAPGQEPDPKYIGGIMDCLAAGLTPDWQRAWIVVRQTGADSAAASRQFVAEFFYATRADDKTGQRLQTCGEASVLENVFALNAYLPESQRRWTGATLDFFRDGRYSVSYDYTPVKPKPAAKPAAKKPPAKKKAESTAK